MTDLTELSNLLTALAPVGAGALVSIGVLMIFTDRLVTKPRLVEEQKAKEQWRRAYEIERDKGDKRDDQVDALVAAVADLSDALGYGRSHPREQ